MKDAFIGTVTGKPSPGKSRLSLLLGSVPRHNSAYFANRADAEKWVAVIRDTNIQAGRSVGLAEVSAVLVDDHVTLI